MHADFSLEIVEARKWKNIYLLSDKRKNYQPNILYLAKILLRNGGEIKMASDQGKLRVLVAKHDCFLKTAKRSSSDRRETIYQKEIWNISKKEEQ